MASAISSVKDGNLHESFLSERYSDFELRHTVYTFKVHKLVICAKSAYFEKLCSNNFVEGRQGYSKLDEDEDPGMIARMLLTMYAGNYNSADAEHVLSAMQRDTLVQVNPVPLLRSDVYPDTYITHAKLYAMADKYQFAALSELARMNFVAAIDENTFTLDDLVDAIDVVYATTLDSDYGLRKHLVYKAQTHLQQLKQLPSFKMVFEKYVGFGWDMATEYKARKSVWCMNCHQESKLPAQCTCGFHGFCRGLKACNDLDWASLKCSRCKRGGKIIRDQPRDDDEVTIIFASEASNARTLPTKSQGPATRGKKRKLI